MIQNETIARLVQTGNPEAQLVFALSVVQPGLDGLMQGSISSLAPLFAAGAVVVELF